MKLRDHIVVVITVIIHQVLGMVWYSQGVFGKQWLLALNKTAAEIDTSYPAPLIVSLVSSVFFCYFLLWLFERVDVRRWNQGAQLGSYIGLILGGGTLALHYSYIGYNYDLIWVDGGFEVVKGFLSGIILSSKISVNSKTP